LTRGAAVNAVHLVVLCTYLALLFPWNKSRDFRSETEHIWCWSKSANIIVIILYVQVTVHHDNLRINNQQDASSIQKFILSRNSTCFGHLLCPSSGVISCTRGHWYVSCRLCGRCRCPKHVEFRDKINFWILGASCWLFIRRLLLLF
jgi:hypothetical protein